MPEYQTLDITDATQFLEFISQVDKKLPILGSGSPQGVVAATLPGIFYLDTSSGQFYFCTSADGTTGGTVWILTALSIANATETTLGIVRLASLAEAAARSNTNKAITPAGLVSYAKNGANTDITSIGGLTTPLAKNQGGTGATSFPDIPSPVGQSGKTLVSDGTVYGLQASTVGIPVTIVTGSGVLVPNSFHLITANSLTLTFPTSPVAPVGTFLEFGFLSTVTGLTISGQKIMNGDSTLTVDVIQPFSLIYTGSTYGWWLRQQ